jgi:MYXO-CTERM domain-containing protein
MGGNGCPVGDVCTSQDTSVGSCVQCTKDADCGGPASGAICDVLTSKCGPGCRGMGGNGCPVGQQCSSTDASAGMCGAGTGTGGSSGTGTGGANDGITASGNGLICAAQPGRGDDDAGAWLLGGLAGLVLASRRRRRR